VRALAVGLACAACSAARPTGPLHNAGGSRDQPPDFDELHEIISAFDDRALPAGCPAEGTAGDYIRNIFEEGTVGSGAGVAHDLTGGCSTDASFAPSRPGYWVCEVHGYREYLDGAPPFDRSVVFYVRLSDRTADLTSLACANPSKGG
jgi:hypothetical protein